MNKNRYIPFFYVLFSLMKKERKKSIAPATGKSDAATH